MEQKKGKWKGCISKTWRLEILPLSGKLNEIAFYPVLI